MIVTLDGERVQSGIPIGCQLNELIEQVRSTHAAPRLIVGVSVNGQRFTDEDFADRLTEDLSAEDQVDFETGDAVSLTSAALRSVAAQLSEASRTAPGIASTLTRGDVAAGMRAVGQFVRQWEQCRTALLQGSELLGVDLTQLSVSDRTLEEHLNELVERLATVRTALENRDLVLLTDTLHYEMPELCMTWVGLLGDLADMLDEAQASERTD